MFLAVIIKTITMDNSDRNNSDTNKIKKHFSSSQCCNDNKNIYSPSQDNILCYPLNTRVLLEAQFLLSFLLKAKKIGHKLYSFARQEEYINGVINQLYNIDNNYIEYKFKINQYISNNDTNNLMKQSIWRPNVVLSIVNQKFAFIEYHVVFYSVCKQVGNSNDNSKSKFLMFFLNCLFHFSSILLNEKQDKDTTIFFQKYFTRSEPIFYGCKGKKFFSKNNVVELIMKQKYFDHHGFSQLLKHKIYILSHVILGCFGIDTWNKG